MVSRTSNYCLHAHDPAAWGRWWAQVLVDSTVPSAEEQADDEEARLDGPDRRGMIFCRVPEPRTVKHRMHVVDRLLGLGATMGDDRHTAPDRGWAVLAGPEGNEFCVLTRDDA